jgi:hypothetical protein
MQTRSKKSNAGPTKAVKADDQQQSKLFVEKAREIGADEEKSAADELIGRLARTPPEPRPKRKQES